MMIMLSILKFLLIALLIILGFLILICMSSISAHIRYWDGVLSWSIHWFGIKILPLPFRRRKKESSDQKSGKKKNPLKKSDKSKPEKSGSKKLFMDRKLEKTQKFLKNMDMAEKGIHALPPALRSLGNALTWYAIETDILIADEDASECARKYGLMQIILQNLFSQTGNLIHVRRKKIQLRYDFVQDKSQYNFRCKAKIHIGRTIGAVIVFLWHYFKDKQNDNQGVV